MAQQRILVIKLGAFGDLVMVDGILRDIRAHHPDAEITLLTAPFYARVWAKCPHIDRCEPDARAPYWNLPARFDLRRRLQSGGYTRVYDLHNKPRTMGYRGWLKDAAWCGGKINVDLNPAEPEERMSIQDRLGALVKTAGVMPRHKADVRWMAEPADSILSAAGIESGFVLLIPGASKKHMQKRWPHYGELANRLAAQELTCVTAPGPDEIDLCRDLPATMLMDDGKPVSFAKLAGLAQHVGFVIGNDTGPTHLMGACATKGLALFGPHTPPWHTGIDRVFDVFEVEDLENLDVDTVLERALKGIRG